MVQLGYISFCLRLEEDARPSNTDMDIVVFSHRFEFSQLFGLVGWNDITNSPKKAS